MSELVQLKQNIETSVAVGTFKTTCGRISGEKGVMGMYQITSKEQNCRACGKTVLENSHHCPNCGVGAPGIYSRCPNCKSENYVYHKYGYAIIRALLATCVCGPLGPVFGFVGYNRTECICLTCNQGWFPFQKDEQLGPFNTFVGEEGKMSRRFKKIPAKISVQL